MARFHLILLTGVVLILAPAAHADVDYRYINMPKTDLGDSGARIDVIRAPLSGAPSIMEQGDVMRMEVEGTVGSNVEVTARPSFGDVREEVELEVIRVIEDQDSDLWPGRTVNVIEVEVPWLDDDFAEDLYDVHVHWTRHWGLTRVDDFQPRALQVVEEIPDEPRVAVIADPQVGDPRAIADAAAESFSERALDPLKYTWDEVAGDLSMEDRWAAFQKVVEELNAQQPDFILVPGDLTFGAEYNYEYEDAYRLMNQFQAPTFVTTGNHDLYDHPFMPDGEIKWQEYFGPLHYSVDIGDDIRLVSIHSYDWPDSQRLFTTWGGSVRQPQLDWITSELTDWRAANPHGVLMTFAHHDPSRDQSPGLVEAVLDGHSQNWSGENRLELRDVMNEAKVDVHFAGHTHTDRVARYVEDDTAKHDHHVIETHAGECLRKAMPYTGTLNDEYSVEDCADVVPGSQDEYREALRDHTLGPLFVETTTVSSGTSSYWGWRMFDLEHHAPMAGERGGIDPNIMGYPLSAEERDYIKGMQPISTIPEEINPDILDVGFYSTPSYLMYVNLIESTDTVSRYEVINNSSVDIDGELLHSLASCEEPQVSGGELVWARMNEDDNGSDLRTSYEVAAGDVVEVEVSTATGPESCEQPEEDDSPWWQFW